MNALTNKEVVKLFFVEIYNNRDYEATYKYFAPNYRDNGPDGAMGIEAAIEVFKKTHKAFPDIKVIIDDLIEENDKVVFRGRFRGTDLGEFAEITPSSMKVEFEALEIFKLEKGKITESWGYWPNSLIVSQLKPSKPKNT